MFKRLMMCIVVLFSLLIGVSVTAQESCDLPLATRLTTLTAACSASALDSACPLAGDALALDELALIGDGQPMLIRLSGTADGEIDLTLIGSRVSSYELSAAPAIEIANATGNNVNIRSGAGANFDVIGIFRFDDRLMTDGQSADGAWLRVQLEDGSIGWVSKSLVVNDAALASLPVVDQESAGTAAHSIELLSVNPDCAPGESGVFVVSTGETPQRISINEIPVSLTGGALFMSLAANTTTFYALAGSASIGTGDIRQDLSPGDVIAWSETPSAPEQPIPFPAIENLEALALTPDVCLIAATFPVDTLDSPAADATVIGSLGVMGSFPADQQSTADSGTWLHVADAFGGGWVTIDSVRTLGTCDSLREVSTSSAGSDGLTADQVMLAYLNARVSGDAGQMQALSCASWDSQAVLQSQSFRAMSAQLIDVACQVDSEDGSSAVVTCSGVIRTVYNGVTRDWTIDPYAMTQEDGAWRVCGEAG